MAGRCKERNPFRTDGARCALTVGHQYSAHVTIVDGCYLEWFAPTDKPADSTMTEFEEDTSK